MDIPPVIRFPNSKEPDDFMSGYWEGLGDGYDLAEKSLLRDRWRWVLLGFAAGFSTAGFSLMAVLIIAF